MGHNDFTGVTHILTPAMVQFKSMLSANSKKDDVGGPAEEAFLPRLPSPGCTGPVRPLGLDVLVQLGG